MKKPLLLTTLLLLLTSFTYSFSQNVKIGYFDDQTVLGLFPGIEEKLRTTLEKYVKDTLQEEYEYSYREYKRLDSNFRKDSATLSSRQRDLANADLDKLKYKLVNWQQYQNQIVEQKQNELLLPYRKQIAQAVNEIVTEQKYTILLKTDAISPYLQPSILDNISIRVAMKLKLNLPKDVENEFNNALKAKEDRNSGKPASTNPTRN